MNDSNQKTLQSYEAHVNEYIKGTPQGVDGVVKEWLDQATVGLTAESRILEIGSAFGRDAAYLQAKGLAVECTDATKAFVELLDQKGFAARELNVISDDLGGPYDLILANAVFLHFTREETAHVIGKAFAALKPGGRLAFTVKQGEGEEWTDKKLGAPRFFCYWSEAQLRPLLDEAGYSDCKLVGDAQTTSFTWVQVIATK
jgi:SAM-dependent methyltransferase